MRHPVGAEFKHLAQVPFRKVVVAGGAVGNADGKVKRPHFGYGIAGIAVNGFPVEFCRFVVFAFNSGNFSQIGQDVGVGRIVGVEPAEYFSASLLLPSRIRFFPVWNRAV